MRDQLAQGRGRGFRADKLAGSCGLPLRPWARRSGMITRKPAAAIAAAWPNLIQLMCASENRPWSRTTGRPCPTSCQASSTPSDAVQWWIDGFAHRASCRSPRSICRPAADARRCACAAGRRCRATPRACFRRRNAMSGVKRAGSSNAATVRSMFGALLELEAERRAARRAIGPPARSASCRTSRAPLSQRTLRLRQILERDRDDAGRALAHPAMAQIGLVAVDLGLEPDPAAGAAAVHRLAHHTAPWPPESRAGC